jgi:hypothetical protein
VRRQGVYKTTQIAIFLAETKPQATNK